jgi:hypothetical protein
MNNDKIQKFVKRHRINDVNLHHNGFHNITPLHLIDTIQTVKESLDYSNYDCGNLDRLMEILFRYVEEHKIPLGDVVPETLNLDT